MVESGELPRGVSRHDYGRTRGFRARAYATDESGVQRCASRLFSYRAHGGETGALAAATAWRLAHEQPRECKRVSGYGYVYRGARKYRTRSGEIRSYDAFIACVWDDSGRASSTSYGVGAHGVERAEALCYQWLAREQEQCELRQAG